MRRSFKVTVEGPPGGGKSTLLKDIESLGYRREEYTGYPYPLTKSEEEVAIFSREFPPTVQHKEIQT